MNFSFYFYHLRFPHAFQLPFSSFYGTHPILILPLFLWLYQKNILANFLLKDTSLGHHVDGQME